MMPYLLLQQTYTATPGKRKRDAPLDSLISENGRMIFLVVIVGQKGNSSFFSLQSAVSAHD